MLSEAKKEGVDKVITVGTSTNDCEKAIKLANSFEQVYVSCGIYPHEHLDSNLDQLIQKLDELIQKNPKVVGVGECGIDNNPNTNYPQRPLNEQAVLFEKQIELAIKKNLPLVIHNRNADDLVIEILDKYPNVYGVMHCFTSSWDVAKKLLDKNFYISFSGIITYPSGNNLHEAVEKTPPDRMLVETDAPWLIPKGCRDKVNEPKYVKITAQKASEIKGISFEEFCNQTYHNTCRLFGISK